jgi:hypothetical protein
MIVDIVDKYRTDDNNPIKNLRLNSKNERMSVSDPGEKIEWGADSEPWKNERVPSSTQQRNALQREGKGYGRRTQPK